LEWTADYLLAKKITQVAEKYSDLSKLHCLIPFFETVSFSQKDHRNSCLFSIAKGLTGGKETPGLKISVD